MKNHDITTLNKNPVPRNKTLTFDLMYSLPTEPSGASQFVVIKNEEYGLLSLASDFRIEITNDTLVVKQNGIADWIYVCDKVQDLEKKKAHYMLFSRADKWVIMTKGKSFSESLWLTIKLHLKLLITTQINELIVEYIDITLNSSKKTAKN